MNPLQPQGRLEDIGTENRGEQDVGVGDEFARFLVAARVKERVLRKLPAKRGDVGGRNVPGLEPAEDRDENRTRCGQRRKSPLCPPLFSTSRMSLITMRLSIALIMS